MTQAERSLLVQRLRDMIDTHDRLQEDGPGRREAQEEVSDDTAATVLMVGALAALDEALCPMLLREALAAIEWHAPAEMIVHELEREVNSVR